MRCRRAYVERERGGIIMLRREMISMIRMIKIRPSLHYEFARHRMATVNKVWAITDKRLEAVVPCRCDDCVYRAVMRKIG